VAAYASHRVGLGTALQDWPGEHRSLAGRAIRGARRCRSGCTASCCGSANLPSLHRAATRAGGQAALALVVRRRSDPARGHLEGYRRRNVVRASINRPADHRPPKPAPVRRTGGVARSGQTHTDYDRSASDRDRQGGPVRARRSALAQQGQPAKCRPGLGRLPSRGALARTHHRGDRRNIGTASGRRGVANTRGDRPYDRPADECRRTHCRRWRPRYAPPRWRRGRWPDAALARAALPCGKRYTVLRVI
jgi:hypothetical protein